MKRLFAKLLNSSYSNLLEAFRKLRGKSELDSAQKKLLLPNVIDKLVKIRQHKALERINLHHLIMAHRIYLTGLHEEEMTQCAKNSAK